MKGDKIQYDNGVLTVPENPIILFIEGDGTGPDLWRPTRLVLETAVEKAYGGSKKIAWMEILAGEKAYNRVKQWLPEETLDKIREYKVAIKGPLTTPVGGGIRSINVALRQKLKLYACVRPVKYLHGVPSPVREPEKVDMVIFRENLEDVYAGIEWKYESPAARKIIDIIHSETDIEIPEGAGIGIKTISRINTANLVRRAVQYALDYGYRNVTLVHKGNIMKYTEGAFREWGYELVKSEFRDQTISEDELYNEHNGTCPEGKIVVKDRIADDMFQQILLKPDLYDVIAAPNLNGDYLSDALAAQVGGLGLSPGANIGDSEVMFEATHGTSPKYAGQDKANPSAMILSGEMMLRFLGWNEAAEMLRAGIEKTILEKRVTFDLHRKLEGATLLKSSEFGEAIAGNIG